MAAGSTAAPVTAAGAGAAASRAAPGLDDDPLNVLFDAAWSAGVIRAKNAAPPRALIDLGSDVLHLIFTHLDEQALLRCCAASAALCAARSPAPPRRATARRGSAP